MKVLEYSEQSGKALKYFNDIILRELNNVCKCWVAGGSLRDYFSGNKNNSDIDLYFPNQEEFDKCLKHFHIFSSGLTLNYKSYNNEVNLFFENQNVIKIIYKGKKLDLIKKFFATPEETISEFDFTVCCASTDGKQIYIHDTFFMDLAAKKLIINQIKYPVSTLYRLQKYIKKGFSICSGGILTLAMAISEAEIHEDGVNLEKLEFYPID